MMVRKNFNSLTSSTVLFSSEKDTKRFKEGIRITAQTKSAQGRATILV